MVNDISTEQKKKIQRIYGDLANVFKPTPKDIEEFKHTMECIEKTNQKTVVKVVTNKSYASKIMRI